jgi:hypothetical protein
MLRVMNDTARYVDQGGGKRKVGRCSLTVSKSALKARLVSAIGA